MFALPKGNNSGMVHGGVCHHDNMNNDLDEECPGKDNRWSQQRTAQTRDKVSE